MKKWVDSCIDRLFVLTGAITFSQIPPFIEQYKAILLGHISELKYQMSLVHESAATSGKSVDEYIMKFLSSSDVDFASQGTILKSLYLRFSDLNSAFLSLTEAKSWQKLIFFLRSLDLGILDETFGSFTPSLQLSLEGVVYILVGALFGSLFYSLLKLPFRRKKNGQTKSNV